MKIVHCCLSNYYIDGFSYQENELVAQNVRDGHEVIVIASTETFGPNREIVYLEPSSYVGSDGALVIRLPYRGLLLPFISRKIRAHPGVLETLIRISPDVILFHGTAGWELLSVAKYKRLAPNIKFYVDSHEDFNNSARTFASRWLLHFFFYRSFLRIALPSIEKILCVNIAAMDFVRSLYGVPASMLEFFPLGGEILDDERHMSLRRKGRMELEVYSDEVVFVQTGKLDRSKRLLQSLRAFIGIEVQSVRFFVAGHLHADIREEVMTIIQSDNRIKFLGWQNASQLRQLLCACDVYVQPGTQSATMQMSLACGCAVVLDEVPSHVPYVKGNGWLVRDNQTLFEAMKSAASSGDLVADMASTSVQIARDILDYRKLAARIYR